MSMNRAIRRVSAWCAVVLIAQVACTASPEEGNDGPPETSVTAASFGSSGEASIAFHSDPGGLDDTYVMTETGEGLVAVTRGMETIAQPHWSPDGTRLVVECCTSDHGRLFLIDGSGAEPIELAPDISGAIGPAWSPDGSTIAFESIDDQMLYLLDVDSPTIGAPRPLGPSGAGPSWSSDGERIVYFAERKGNVDIYTVSVDGSDVERLTRDEAADHSPRWSPSGRIASVSERGGDQDVFVMDGDGSNQLDFSRNPWPDDFPAWSPDGHLLAYVAYLDGADPLTVGDGNAEIYVVAADGSRNRPVSGHPAWDGDPSWSPDGSVIAFTRRTDRASVHVMRPDGTGDRTLEGVGGTANDCCPSWRP